MPINPKSVYFRTYDETDTNNKNMLSNYSYSISKKDLVYKQSISSDTTLQSHKKNSNVLEIPSLSERGVPEGQEDPYKHSSKTNLAGIDKSCPPTTKETKVFGKAYLVGTFLRSIQIQNSLIRTRINATKCECYQVGLFVNNFQKFKSIDQSEVEKIIKDELERHVSETNRSKDFHLTNNVLDMVGRIYKIFKVLSHQSLPTLSVIASDALYFINYNSLDNDFNIHYRVPFEKIIAACLGPFAQLVILLCEEKEPYLINTGYDNSLASDFISFLELAIRRNCQKHRKLFKFSVDEIYDYKLMSKFHPIVPETMFNKNEKIVAQYTVWINENSIKKNYALGSKKEGYLMIKMTNKNTWYPIYVCLKDGVLYLFDESTMSIPHLSFSLNTGDFKSCKIFNDYTRPYTFQLILNNKQAILFGTADETELNEWIFEINSSSQLVRKWL